MSICKCVQNVVRLPQDTIDSGHRRAIHMHDTRHTMKCLTCQALNKTHGKIFLILVLEVKWFIVGQIARGAIYIK